MHFTLNVFVYGSSLSIELTQIECMICVMSTVVLDLLKNNE